MPNQRLLSTRTNRFDKDVWQGFGPRVAAGVIKCANDPIFLSYVDFSFRNLDNNSSKIPLASGISVVHRQPGFPGRCTLRFPSSNQLTLFTQLLKIGQTRCHRLISIPLGLNRVIRIFTSKYRYTSFFAFDKSYTDVLSGAIHVPAVDWHDPGGPHFVIYYCTTSLACPWTVCSTRDPTIQTQQSQRDYPEYRGGRANVPYQRSIC